MKEAFPGTLRPLGQNVSRQTNEKFKTMSLTTSWEREMRKLAERIKILENKQGKILDDLEKENKRFQFHISELQLQLTGIENYAHCNLCKLVFLTGQQDLISEAWKTQQKSAKCLASELQFPPEAPPFRGMCTCRHPSCDEARALHAARYDGNETVLQKYISIVRTVQGNDQTTWNSEVIT